MKQIVDLVGGRCKKLVCRETERAIKISKYSVTRAMREVDPTLSGNTGKG